MNMTKIIGILAFSGILFSCATPVGKFKESDMAWTQLELDENYQVIFRNIKQGFRKCGSHLFPDGNLYTDINQGSFDVYLPTILGGKSLWVYGVIKIYGADPDHSTVDIGVNNNFDDPVFGKKGEGRKIFSEWASKIYSCEKEQEA